MANIYLGDNALGTVAVDVTYQCDPTPVQGSTNAVQSGGVYEALAEVQSHAEQIGAETKNYVDEKVGNFDSYTKDEVLTDETKAGYGLDSVSVPDDVFNMIRAKLGLIMNGVAEISVTVKTAGGTPVSGVIVSGVYDEAGESVYTNDSGVASGYVAEGETTIGVQNYIDIVDTTDTSSYIKGNAYTKTLTVTQRSELTITSSKSIRFSGLVSTFDACAVGGGGGGGGGGCCGYNALTTGGGGGGGGYVVSTFNNVVQKGKEYTVIVGAGGAGGKAINVNGSAGSKGGDGGASSLIVDGTTVVTANGGGGGDLAINYSSGTVTVYGGAGNGKGGNGSQSSYTAGTAGNKYIFDDSSMGLVSGGGGGADAGGRYAGGGLGGNPYGGEGAAHNGSDAYNAAYGAAGSNTGGGGGGGGGLITNGTRASGGAGGAGYRGAVYLRWEVVA